MAFGIIKYELMTPKGSDDAAQRLSGNQRKSTDMNGNQLPDNNKMKELTMRNHYK